MVRKDVTPAEIEAAYNGQKARLPIVSEADQLAATVVLLPDLGLRGWSGWLCKVCRRVPLRNQKPWSWFGCESCRAVDRRAAALFGGRRILPLGQHSIMNGASIRLSTPDGPGLTARFEQFAALGRGWQDLDAWAVLEGDRLVAQLPEEGRRADEQVPLPQWQEWFPPSRAASADAFVRLIGLQQPWLIDMERLVGDVRGSRGRIGERAPGTAPEAVGGPAPEHPRASAPDRPVDDGAGRPPRAWHQQRDRRNRRLQVRNGRALHGALRAVSQ